MGVLAGASLMRVGACGTRRAIPGGLSDSHMAVADTTPEDAGKRVRIVARDHGAAPWLAGRPEHMNGARTANLLRAIPEGLRNDPQLELLDDDVAFFRIAALLLLLRFRIENC
jgi:hypothetical protein